MFDPKMIAGEVAKWQQTVQGEDAKACLQRGCAALLLKLLEGEGDYQEALRQCGAILGPVLMREIATPGPVRDEARKLADALTGDEVDPLLKEVGWMERQALRMMITQLKQEVFPDGD